MTAAPNSRPGHVLLFEPRTEGHHPGWLRFIAEDLLSANVRLSLAVDLRPEAMGILQDHLAGLLSQVNLVSVCDDAGRRHGAGRVGSVATCLRASGADQVFLCAWDEVASACWRRATFGIFPPEELRGRMGGIYHRPRFLVAPAWSPNGWLKQIGFRRLLRQNWLRQLLFVDEYLAADLQRRLPGAPVYFLPDPCPAGFNGDAREARRRLGVPEDKVVFLFYGGGYRRKGLHLAAQALRKLPVNSPAFLLCAGRQNPTGETARVLEDLVRQNRARVLNRYVSSEEERLCFEAGDAVLLPYLNHFGTSGVLSRAVAAGKPVIVSDEQLLGRLTREHGLGLLFPSGEVEALRGCLQQATQWSPGDFAKFSASARAYAGRYSRQAYRDALLRSLGLILRVAGHGA